MKFIDILKDPASYIWGFIDKARGKQVIDMSSQEQNSAEVASEKPSKNYNFDFMWLFRGKTGLFLKIFIPAIIILAIISSVTNKPTPPPVTPPPVVDPGDTLDTPDFVSSNYVSGVSYGETNLLYSTDQKSINEIGVTGVVLSSLQKDTQGVEYYFPVSKTDNVYLLNNNLVLEYEEVRYEKQYGKDVEIREVKSANLLEGINDINEIIDLKLTSDGNITLQYQDKFYVYDQSGQKIDEYIINDLTSLYSYYNGEIYYIKTTELEVESVSGEQTITSLYTLVRMNSNKEVIYEQDLGSSKIHNLFILNSDRYLFLFERPSERSFFFVQMKDSDGRTVFGFIPQERVQKLTDVEHFYFSPQNNTVLFVGGGISKLFTSTGKQLWIK